ncbi:hypothetical protein TcCL_Unassigned02040 [Trypanosoma cruzi]|nr:hypothetical protein TcCL_Unassigned02040 [Trypanosoma cruzi]
MHQRGASSPQTVRTAPTPQGPHARTILLLLIFGSLPPHPTPAPHNTRGKHKTAEAATTAKLPPCCAEATARKGVPATGVHRAGDGNEPSETPKSHTLAVLSGLPQRNHNK